MFLRSFRFSPGSSTVIFCVAAFALIQSAHASSEFYTIEISSQSGDTPTEIVNQLSAQGNDKLFLLEDQGHSRANFGRFSYYMEAAPFAKGFEDAGYITSIEKLNESVQVPQSSNISPHKWQPIMFARSHSVLSSPLDRSHSLVSAIENNIYTSTTAELEEIVSNEMINRESDDPIKGWLALKMAYLNIRKGDMNAATTLFEDIGTGAYTSNMDVYCEAMKRLGHLYHRQGDRDAAYEFFSEMRDSATNTEDASYALLQLAGLTMEMARSEKGTLDETRLFIEQALNPIPESHFAIRATMELMRAETLYFAERYDEAILEFDAYLEKYTDDPIREVATATIFLGLSHAKRDEFNIAESIVGTVLDMPIGPDDQWKHIPDLKRHALTILMYIAQEKGDRERFDHWHRERMDYDSKN